MQSDAQNAEAVRSLRRFRIVVQQTGIDLPFEEKARELLQKCCNIPTVAAEEESTDGTLIIRASGAAISALYRSSAGGTSSIYSGSRLEGEIIIERAGTRILSRSFRAGKNPPSTLLSLSRDRDESSENIRAVLMSAFEETGSFLHTFLRIQGEICGPKALIQACDTNTVQRLVPAEMIAGFGDNAVDPLIEALAHKAFYVRDKAHEALGLIRNPRAIGPLIEAIKRPDPERSAVEALGRFQDSRATAALSAALKDRSFKLRPLAATMLGSRTEAGVTELLSAALRDPDREVQLGAAEGLASGSGRERMPMITGLLGHPDSSVRERAAGFLVDKAGPAELSPILEALKSAKGTGEREHNLKLNLLRSAALIGDPRCAEALVDLWGLASCQWERDAYAEAIGRSASGTVVDTLIRWLSSEDAEKAAVAALSLGRIGDKRAVAPLLVILEEKQRDYNLREAAVRALGRLGDARAFEPLLAIVADPSCALKEQAALALGDLGDRRAAKPILQAQRNLGNCGVNPILGLIRLRDPSSAEALIDALGAKAWDVRTQAAEALGALKERRAVQRLIALLDGGESEPLAQAAAALGEIGDTSAVPKLMAALHADSSVRLRSAEALGKLKDRRAVAPLQSLLEREMVWDVRAAAAKALGELGDPASLRSLLPLLFAERPEVRIEAVRALSKLNDLQAFEPLLLTLRRDDAPVREAAVQALRGITGQDFGSDADRWEAWFRSRTPSPPGKSFAAGIKKEIA